jgi:hypothetical protein
MKHWQRNVGPGNWKIDRETRETRERRDKPKMMATKEPNAAKPQPRSAAVSAAAAPFRQRPSKVRQPSRPPCAAGGTPALRQIFAACEDSDVLQCNAACAATAVDSRERTQRSQRVKRFPLRSLRCTPSESRYLSKILGARTAESACFLTPASDSRTQRSASPLAAAPPRWVSVVDFSGPIPLPNIPLPNSGRASLRSMFFAFFGGYHLWLLRRAAFFRG